MLNKVLISRVSRVSAMVSVRFSGMFNVVQEFGTAVYRIANLPPSRTAIFASDKGTSLKRTRSGGP